VKATAYQGMILMRRTRESNILTFDPYLENWSELVLKATLEKGLLTDITNSIVFS